MLFEWSNDFLSSQDRVERWGKLGFVTAPVIGAYFYNLGYRIPFLGCPLRALTGIPCPICGMTRSFMAIAHFEITEAFTEHLFGPVLFIGLLLEAVRIGVELRTRRRIKVFYDRLISDRPFRILALLTILSYYAIRLCYLSGSGELYLAFVRSPLGQLIFSLFSSLQSQI